jgi:hypothetical protein
MRWLAPLAAVALAVLPACSRGPKLESETAVRQALDRYLASRPNLNMPGMETQITGIQFRGEQAHVDVVFRAKSGGESAGGSMTMRYTLNRKGDRWEVEPQSGAHGGMTPPPGEMPPGHPPVKKQ